MGEVLGSPLNPGLDGKPYRLNVKGYTPPSGRKPVGRCHYCFRIPQYLTRDHIVPRGSGGADAAWNITPSCLGCNAMKANSNPTCRCDRCTVAVGRHIEHMEEYHKITRFSRIVRLNPILVAYGFEPIDDYWPYVWYVPESDTGGMRLSAKQARRLLSDATRRRVARDELEMRWGIAD